MEVIDEHEGLLPEDDRLEHFVDPWVEKTPNLAAQQVDGVLVGLDRGLRAVGGVDIELRRRAEEARRSLAWALMIDPRRITLPATLLTAERARWLELFRYPRLVASGCLTGLTQTGGTSIGLWGPTLLVLVLVPRITPEYAAFLMIFVNLAGVLGRFSITLLIEPLGRRGSGTLYCVMAAILIVCAGYMYDVYIGTWSLFYTLIVAQGFFSSAIYTVVGPYMSEIWPARLRSSGMGMSYGVGNLGGKVLGPAGLAGGSYTHLTMPTHHSVWFSVVALALQKKIHSL